MRMAFEYAPLFLLLGALLRQVPVAQGHDSAATDILSLERATWQTYQDKDARGYRRLLAADYVNVGGDGIFGLDKELRDMIASGVETFDLSQMKVHFPAPNVAVVTYVVSLARSNLPRRGAMLFYDASVWVRSAGIWKTVLHTHAKREK
jgi:hypothetical protein